MSMQDVPGGPGRFARRNDLGNVKKIQREGRDISESSGGPYRQRKELQELSQGAPTESTVAETSTISGNPLVASVPRVDAFAQGSGAPLSDGAEGGPGRNSSILQTPVDAIDQTSVLARAMFLANPNSTILANIVNGFNEEGR